MRYQIEGESQQTKQPVTVIVDADSTLGARKQADAMGIDIVTLGTAPQGESEPSQPLPIRPALSQKPRAQLIAILLVFAIAAIAMLASLFLFRMAPMPPAKVPTTNAPNSAPAQPAEELDP